MKIGYIHNVAEKDVYKAYKLFFNTFRSESRLKIINLLRNKPMNVSEIIKKLKIDQSNVSHDLRRLKSCGFVESKIKGKYREYYLNKETILPIIEFIDKHMKKYCLMIITGKRRWN